jgi:uncharacterized protein YdhG (YjbR/CyaY superfamily)
MAKKGGMPTYKTADDYIAAQSPEAQTMLKEIRALILEAAPDAQELINYKVPSYSLVENGKRDQQIMMAAYAKFIGFYPFPTTMEAFAEDLKDYVQGKGSVQFPFDKPLPKELIKKMVKYRRNELLNKMN